MKKYLVLLYPELTTLIFVTLYWVTNKWYWLVPSPLLLVFMVVVNRYSPNWLRPIKGFWWELIRKTECERILLRHTPEVAKYPMLIWLNFDAKELYLTLHQSEFAKATADKMYEITVGILNGFNEDRYNPYTSEYLDWDDKKIIDDFLAKEKRRR